jgi:hypothetical protein
MSEEQKKLNEERIQELQKRRFLLARELDEVTALINLYTNAIKKIEEQAQEQEENKESDSSKK